MHQKPFPARPKAGTLLQHATSCKTAAGRLAGTGVLLMACTVAWAQAPAAGGAPARTVADPLLANPAMTLPATTRQEIRAQLTPRRYTTIAAEVGARIKSLPVAEAGAFLRRHGNPYRRLGRDEPGRTAIDWGVYGVPETYLLDRQGMIRWRWAGPITTDTLESELRPLLRRFA